MGEMIQVFPHLERDKTQLKGVLLRGKDVVVFFFVFQLGDYTRKFLSK